jgi:hypothetical protein
MRRLLNVASVLAGLATLLAAGPAHAECMRANTENQIAEGRLTVLSAKDAAGRRQRPYILRTPVPVCLDGSDPEERVKSTQTIHVYPANDALGWNFKRMVGKTVLVRGNPFPRHTMHHHAPIVMEVTEIDTH